MNGHEGWLQEAVFCFVRDKMLHDALMMSYSRLMAQTCCVLLGMSGPVCAGDGWEDVPSCSWMSHIEGSRPVSDINLPGTHNSGAEHVTAFVRPFARCQDRGVGQQLKEGVRYLDIRLAGNVLSNEPFHLCHGSANCYTDNPGLSGGVENYLPFSRVLGEVYAFLAAHPGETVVMCIQEQQSSLGRDGRFERLLFERYLDCAGTNPATSKPYWHLGGGVPRLDEARGKIVLMRRFSDRGVAGRETGIDATGWKDNTGFTLRHPAATLHIADCYKEDGDRKWASVASYLQRTAEGEMASGEPVLIFASGNTMPKHSPLAIARDMNKRLLGYDWKAAVRYGWVIVDFVTEPLARKVFSTNKKTQPPE